MSEEKDIVNEQQTPDTSEADAVDPEVADAEFDLADYMRQYKELETVCEKAKQATEDAEAKLLRMQADFDNYRRRQRNESEEAGRRAIADLVAALLPVIDNFERALDAMSNSADKEGVELISKLLMQTLETAGLAEIAAQDADFDPKFHQAVSQADAGKDKKGKIVQVLQKGYTLGDKLLRAAMVQVGM